MKVIAFINQKGGVGKTTTCLNVGAALSLCGFKCLLVDVDPQGSLSQSAGYDNLSDDDYTTYEVLKGVITTAGAIESGDYDILPTDIRLSAAEIELVSSERRNYLLRDALSKVKERYDFILIDCPPSLNIFTLMALAASDEVIIPVEAQYLPLKGVSQIVDTVELVKAQINPKLDVGGILVTFYDGRRNLDKDVLEALKEYFGDKVFTTTISRNTKVAEAPSHGVDIFKYCLNGSGARQYMSLAQEILKHETTEGKER